MSVWKQFHKIVRVPIATTLEATHQLGVYTAAATTRSDHELTFSHVQTVLRVPTKGFQGTETASLARLY